MTFTVPKVCLTLKTRKKAFTKKIKSSSTEWELKTELEQIDFKMHQGDQKLQMDASVSSLKVSDNSGDERFQFIFQNLPVEGQVDLVTFKMLNIEKNSPDF